MNKVCISFLLVIALIGVPFFAFAQLPDDDTRSGLPDDGTGTFLPDDGTRSGLPDDGTGSNSCGGTGGIGISNPLKDICTIPQFIKAIFERIVLPLGMSIAVLFIVYSGFLFVTAQGNETKLTKAKSAFFWAIIGTAVLFGSWAIATIISNTIDELTAFTNLGSLS